MSDFEEQPPLGNEKGARHLQNAIGLGALAVFFGTNALYMAVHGAPDGAIDFVVDGAGFVGTYIASERQLGKYRATTQNEENSV